MTELGKVLHTVNSLLNGSVLNYEEDQDGEALITVIKFAMEQLSTILKAMKEEEE